MPRSVLGNRTDIVALGLSFFNTNFNRDRLEAAIPEIGTPIMALGSFSVGTVAARCNLETSSRERLSSPLYSNRLRRNNLCPSRLSN